MRAFADNEGVGEAQGFELTNQIDDLDADTQSLSGSFVYFFALAGMTSSLQVDFPVADTRFEGG